MENALAWLSVESLRRIWSDVSAADIEASQDEDELVRVIAARTGDEAGAVHRRLAAVRGEAVMELRLLFRAAPRTASQS